MSFSRNRSLLEKLLGGMPPSTVLNMMLEADPELDKYALANIFLEECELLDSRVLPLVWHWRSSKSIRGMSDKQFDEAVLILMRAAGYSV